MSQSLPAAFGEFAGALDALASHDVEFILCGGLACFLHGSSRHTEDVDIAVRLERQNLQRLIDAAKSLNLQPRIPEPMENLLDERKRDQWIKEKNALVYTFVSPGSSLQIDVFLGYPIDFDTLMRHADVFDIGGRTVRISSKQHLIEAKRAVQPLRLQDEFDIRFLEERIGREQ